MADLNALIAQGYQPQAQIDPFAQYAKMQQLQQGEQANQLNQMKMQEYQRGMKETNAMRRLDPTSATYLQDITRINPEKGFAFAKLQQEAGNARTQGQINSTELLTKKLAMLPDAYRMADTPEAYVQLHESIHADPVIGPYLKSVGATPDKGRAAIQQAVETGKFDELRMGSMQSVNQILESMKPQVVAPSASVYQGGRFTQAPAAPAAAAAPTPLAKLQNELAALPPGDPRRAEYVSAIRKETQFAPTASTTVNMPVQEKAEQGKRGEMLIEEFKAISASAKNAAKNLPALETQERILNEGFKTGFGSGAQKAGASVLAALGVPEAEKYATSAETFNAAANNAVLQKQLEQKGTQSQSDADRMEKTIAQLGNTVESNKFIISIAKAQLKRDIEQRNFYSGWYSKNKTYDGAEDSWFNSEGGKSLFDRPELKAYKQSTAAPAVAPAAATQGTGGFKYLGVVPTEGKK